MTCGAGLRFVLPVVPQSAAADTVSCTVVVSAPVPRLRASQRNWLILVSLFGLRNFRVACGHPDSSDAECLTDVACLVSFFARSRISLIRIGRYPVRSTHTFT